MKNQTVDPFVENLNLEAEFPMWTGWLSEYQPFFSFEQELSSSYSPKLNQEVELKGSPNRGNWITDEVKPTFSNFIDEKEVLNSETGGNTPISNEIPQEVIDVTITDSLKYVGKSIINVCLENNANTVVPEDLTSSLLSTLGDLREKQDQVDNGTYWKTGPGRNRKYGPLTSGQLKLLVKKYLRNSISTIVSDCKCASRNDALLTIYFRALKKLTFHLVQRWAARTLYKDSDVSKHLIAFAESFSSFLFSISQFDEQDLVQSFIEYIVIYFPVDKVRGLVTRMMKQTPRASNTFQTQLEILSTRDLTSKKNIKRWVRNSSIMRTIWELGLDVLQEKKFQKSDVAKRLIISTQHILSL